MFSISFPICPIIEFLFWKPETQKQEVLRTARTKSQGGGTREERSVLREQGVQMPRRERDENNHHQMLENLASCRLWSCPSHAPLPPLPPAPASSHACPHAARKAAPCSAPWSDSRHKANGFIAVCPPIGSFVSMTTATPWHCIGTVIVSHRSKLLRG